MSPKTRKWLRRLVPVLILLVGFAAMRLLIDVRQAPIKTHQENPGALVEIMTASLQDHTATLYATGTVQPGEEISLIPQVTGKVEWVSPQFAAGGFFREGEPMLRIEAADYRLAVEQASASLAKAEYDLATVQSQARVARQEWQRLHPDSGEPANPLVLYGPQLKNAEAGVAAARASLDQARLNLDRTQLAAPFNALVRNEQVDRGQYLRAGNAVATLTGTDRAEVLVPLPFEDLPWLDIPRSGSGRLGSPATLRFDNGEATLEWRGHIVRTLGDVDERGRMARVVVSVPDPYNLQNRPDVPGQPLAVGMFVRSVFQGAPMREVIAIPRKALRDNDSVWFVDADNLLRIRPVHIVRREEKTLWLDEGIHDGDRIVLSALSAAADGLKLRPVSAGEQP